MSHPVISVENLSKSYRLGQIGTGTLSRDLKVWWARTRGKPNPLLRIGQTDPSHRDGEILWALRDVTLQVDQGEVLGIIGRNGAGKSTLLKILSRVTAPTSGCVKVKGRIASLLEVGTGFHPELTGRENIYLNGAILGMTKEEVRRRFDEIVAFAEIDKFIDTPVKRYSSGMYVRLAFAVAAHLESEILLVDEVLAVGDADFQKKCLGKMGDVASREGRTVLFISHNLSSIQQLCSRGLMITKGEVAFQGDTQAAVENYLDSIEGLTSELINESKRYGIGDAKITKIEARSASGFIQAGQPMDLVFSLDKFLPGLTLQFTIYDSRGSAVATFDSATLINQDEVDPSLKKTIICRIKDVPLVPGKYRLNTSLKNVYGIQDHLDGSFYFSVRQGLIDGRLIREGSHYGNVHINHKWQVPEK